MTETLVCKHEETRLIAKDNEAQYIECLVCGAILDTYEAAEDTGGSARETASPDNQRRLKFDESLSDA